MAGFSDEHRFLENQKIFIQSVRDPHLCLELTASLLGDAASEINQMYADNAIKASERLADCIIRSEQCGKWEELKRALKATDFPYLEALISGTQSLKKNERRIIEIFAPALVNRISPMDMIPELLAANVINDSDYQQIIARFDSKGPMAATIMLLDQMKVRLSPDQWYPRFLDALLQQGHEDMVKQIDPDYSTCYQESKNSHPDTDTDDTGRSACMEVDSCSVSQNVCSSWAGPSSIHEAIMTEHHQSDSCISNMSPAPNVVDMYTCQSKPTEIYVGGVSVKPFQEAEADSCSSQTQVKEEKVSVKIEVKEENYEPADKIAKTDKDCDDSDCSDYRDVDDTNDDAEDNSGPPSTFQLRKFQLELAERALCGENTIINCETGTGKTFVALHIIREHLRRSNKGARKVVFLARTSALVNQQTERLKKFLPEYLVEKLTGDDETAQMMGSRLPNVDIFGLTPQILVNNLQVSKSITSLSQFSLMIFDECHHTMKDAPYNMLMRHYLMEKTDRPSSIPNLPQIVGLTASVGVGRARSDMDAVDHILELCANLDVRQISTVEREREDVEKYISKPKEQTIAMKPQCNTVGKRILLSAIQKTEDKMEDLLIVEKDLLDEWGKTPREKESNAYLKWLIDLDKMASSRVTDMDQSRNIVSCIRHLCVYTAALEVNTLLSLQDVAKYLAGRFQNEGTQQDKLNDVEKELFKNFKAVQRNLVKNSSIEKNPNTRQIQDMLKSLFSEKRSDSRAMVFVQARATCKALASFLDKALKEYGIFVCPLFGKNRRGDEEGMTESEQNHALKQFEEGNCHVLVATSVGGEGIDIKQCNIVISYNYTGNEISKIQMAGRIRNSSDGANIIIGDESVVRQQELNVYKIQMMYRAMEEYNKMDRCIRDRRIDRIQQKNANREIHRQRSELRNSGKDNTGDYELKCRGCSVHACFNTDLRCVITHHIVVNREFHNRVNLKAHKQSPKTIDGFTMTKKIFCNDCPNHWGVMFEKDCVPCHVLKLESFKVVDRTTGITQRYKKWRDVPFQPDEVDFGEIQRLYMEWFPIG